MNNTIQLNHCPKCGAPIPAEAPQGLCARCVLLGVATSTETGVSPTATSEIPSLERISQAFPHLEILDLVGRGGMGFVFKARQPHLGRLVALKLLPDKLARDPRFAERFNREGRVLARLNHSSIVSVYDFGRTEHFYFLIMEFVDGVNLRQAMQAGRFSPGEALRIVPRICEALQYAHEQGILHRDIKPGNILLDARGQVKIADFGIAKLLGEEKVDVTLTATGAALGTPHYMAPEQLERPSEVDHRADIYSLGVVFYEMLTGELPIGRFAAPSSKTPVNSGVDEVVFRTLEKDRERRYQSAGEMKTQVEHLGEGAGAAMTPEAAETEPRRFSHWSIYGSALVGLSLPVPLALVAAMLGGRGGIGTGELWAALGSVAVPGLGGTLLGVLGLNEIREGGGRLLGLPLAVFACLTWPLLALGVVVIGLPALMLMPAAEPTVISMASRVLFLALPAGTITFGIWAIYATARWASRPALPRRRGLLKWVFIGLVVAGIGPTMAFRTTRREAARRQAEAAERAQEAVSVSLGSLDWQKSLSQRPALSGPRPRPGEVLAYQWLQSPVGNATTNTIRFTFTNVELRSEGGTNWMALDYATAVRGDCEEVFRIDGGPFTTRKTGLLVTPDGAPPVMRQRFEWQIPAGARTEVVTALIQEFSKALVGKSFVIPEGEQRPLLRLPIGTVGDVSLGIGARPRALSP
jgi:tRNA A-37 threonylcarbamoyl transferase component Bud32